MSDHNRVQAHYNEKTTNADNLSSRFKSPIFYMRNFNNWIKSVLISEYSKKLRQSQSSNNNNNKKISVLDLGSGKGGDILKWKKANVCRVTFIDLSENSLDECMNRYSNGCHFDAQFIHMDATRELISEKISANYLKHDLVSSQFVIHYSFESYKQADTFLLNVSDSLVQGGYFIGTTTDSNELISRLKRSKTNQFGNDLYNIKFHEKTEEFPLFGTKFDFQLDNVVECPEFLLNFKVLIKLAARHYLQLVFESNFAEFYESFIGIDEYRRLISVMKAMEVYHSNGFNKGDTIEEECKSKEYSGIEKCLVNDKESEKGLEEGLAYLTLSESEWEAIGLYKCFAFVKV